MKIAQISPLYESVPPQYYGGTERVISYLTEELVKQGHEVTLLASGDSSTKANLVPITPRSLRLDEKCIDSMAHHLLLIERMFQESGKFDVIHSHIDYLPFPFIRRNPGIAIITTLHGRLDLPDLVPLYQEFSDIPLISVSDAQRKPLPWANWLGTVHHGLPADLYTCREEAGRYLAFVGRISPEKRVDLAIEVALQAGIPLKIAAKVDKVDEDYYKKVIEPLLENSLIEFIGEIGDLEKNDFLRNAYALIFPIDWPEPFGLVMIEAMACGTPVIACSRGAVPEVVDEGLTGFIVEDVAEAVAAVKKIPQLSRKHCRMVFEERFTAARMAQDYLKIYQELIQQKEPDGQSLLEVEKE